MCNKGEGNFVSTIIARKKKDGNIRTVLNLKSLNEYVTCHHFKMYSEATCILTKILTLKKLGPFDPFSCGFFKVVFSRERMKLYFL